MILVALVILVSSYEIGCIYPPMMDRNPFKERFRIAGIMTRDIARPNKWETPIVVRSSHMSITCQAKCLSLHYPGVNNPIDKNPAEFKVPAFGQNVWSVAMCNHQCVHTLFEGWADFSQLFATSIKNEIDLELTSPSPKVVEATEKYLANNRDFQDLKKIVVDADYDPLLIGQLAGLFLKPHFLNDGWNQEGKYTWDPVTQMKVECTSSCRAFQTTTGYSPVNDPRNTADWEWGKKPCTGDCTKWQPLQEEDGYGSLLRQEFVVPHIGTEATVYLREPTMEAPAPNYDYVAESEAVIERLRQSASDDVKQAKIKLFDDKLDVRHIFQKEMRSQFSSVHSYQDHILYLFGLSSAEYEGAVQAWKEKVRHDLVRPTTVIKSWGSQEMIDTYSPDAPMGETKTISAVDFEAFIRVMPHGEHPSGSSCLCKTYAEFSDAYTNARYGSTLMNLQDTAAGIDLTWSTANDLLNECGQSRLWGGLHYPQAIPDGESICTGLGALAFDWVTAMKKTNEDWIPSMASAYPNFGPYYDNSDAQVGSTYHLLPTCSESD